ncbi:3-dehydroquinate synthase [Helicobacter sp. 11S03491-1]|uniref:3-dehydroquinate synthase n=1 Tax=Helicobacter sp. 11S03491-1 TaxID=1476196 RepID=UPI000BA7B96D|nr:3-dehydroquinate synthase [Helicobacter sp. 11S03491-1]PAF41675.1 3-dehydroquinate synthase [Helicobacter sp. 11S03491-1]
MKTILLRTQNKEYPIKIGNLENITHKGKVLVISNPKVAGLYLDRLLKHIQADEVYVSIIPDGENYKTLETLQDILEVAFSSRLDRKSLMIALGGGVVSDMVGFASGIYHRGIDFVSVPTTLLAQIDASVGGKTGVNNQFGKNLIGVFHQPSVVYICPDFLSSLPPREFRAGVAEMIKMAVCFDEDLFVFLEQNSLDNPHHLQTAIAKCIEIKANVVSMDEREEGIRAALNYGHTFGHVIENETNYSQFLHGEAVAIGMKMANQLALSLGYLDEKEFQRIHALLEKYSLDLKYSIEDIEAFYDKFFLDKKSHHQKIKFILPNSIGDKIICDNILKKDILEILKKWSKT